MRAFFYKTRVDVHAHKILGELAPPLSRQSPKKYPRDLELPWEKGRTDSGKNPINSGKIGVNAGKILLMLGKSFPEYNITSFRGPAFGKSSLCSNYDLRLAPLARQGRSPWTPANPTT